MATFLTNQIIETYDYIYNISRLYFIDITSIVSHVYSV